MTLRQHVTPRASGASPTPERARRSLRPLVLAACALAAPALAWGARHALLRTPAFAVRRVVVTGTVNASRDEVAKASRALSRNALALDLEAVRRRVVALPWIADATVRRALPHELRIAVRERVPVAVEAQGDARLALDASGSVLGATSLALPEVAGVAARPAADRDDARALACATVAAVGERAPALLARVRALDVSARGHVVLRVDGAPPLWVSGPESADEVLAFFRREHGIERAIGRASRIDARWSDRLYVVPESSGGVAVPSRPPSSSSSSRDTPRGQGA